jgi:membrane-bound inhibitor of C-type lysozyme
MCKMTYPRVKTIMLFIATGCALAGCGSMPSMPSLWPFGDKGAERPRIPPGATEYVCDGGRKLYVRFIDNGKSAWVILPEREFRLNPVITASGARYGNGTAVLETKGNEASLSDGPTVTHANCKSGVAAQPAS